MEEEGREVEEKERREEKREEEREGKRKYKKERDREAERNSGQSPGMVIFFRIISGAREIVKLGRIQSE